MNNVNVASEISKAKLLPALFLQYHPDNDLYYKTTQTVLQRPDPNIPDLEALYFSQENIDIVKRMVVLQVFKRSNQQFHIDPPSNPSIIHYMRYIFNIYSQNQRFNITQQIRQLNQMVCDLVVPKVIIQSQQYIGYLKDKFEKRELLDLPVNANLRKGARTTRSTFQVLQMQ